MSDDAELDARLRAIQQEYANEEAEATARSGKREYEVFEDALRGHLGFGGAVEGIWAGISPDEAPSEDEAARLAASELAQVRAERSTREAG